MANYTESWNRLEQVICWAKMSTNHFAHHIGLLRPDILYHIKAGKIGLSKNLVQRIVAKYPEISPGWLLTGDGVMLREDSRLIPYVDGGIAELKLLIEGKEEAPTPQYLNLPMVGDCDYAYRSYDEAMSDQIMPGTIVFLKKTENLHRYPIIFQKTVSLHFWGGRKLIFEKVILSNTTNKSYRRDNGSERKIIQTLLKVQRLESR